MIVVLIIVIFALMIFRKKKMKDASSELFIAEEYYLEDGNIFNMALSNLLDHGVLLRGIAPEIFHKYLLRYLKKNPPLDKIDVLEKVFNVLPVKDKTILENYLEFFIKQDFTVFLRFLKLLKSIGLSDEIFNEKIKNDYILMRIKTLRRSDFSELSDGEIAFYEECFETIKNRVSLIKIADIFFSRNDFDKSLYYYDLALNIPQEHDKLFKSTLRKISSIYNIIESFPESIYYLFILHSTDPSHKLAEEELIQSLKQHHIMNFYNELSEVSKMGKKEFVDFMNEMFHNRNLNIT